MHDFLADARQPSLIDAWVCAALLFAYVLFYVLVLDRNQIHLYIIFTPRTHFCILAYAVMVLLQWGVLEFWAAIGRCDAFSQLSHHEGHNSQQPGHGGTASGSGSCRS